VGLPGLIAFVALYLGAFWMVARIWRTPETASLGSLSSRALALGLGGGLFAHLVYGLTDAVALGAKPGFLFWMSLGLITGLFLQTRPDRDLTGSNDRGKIDTNATTGT
jgi:putative inorganic carbon (hco3(-)) transporter